MITTIRKLGGRARTTVVGALALTLAACGGGSDAGRADSAGAAAACDTAGMAGMQHGAATGAGQNQMASQMQAHMRMMPGAGGDSLKAMLPSHRQMAANMIAQFNQEMRGMNMTPDATWNAVVDSLRQDLRTMPEMGAAELERAMPAHHARLSRLMELHQGMMKNMKM